MFAQQIVAGAVGALVAAAVHGSYGSAVVALIAGVIAWTVVISA